MAYLPIPHRPRPDPLRAALTVVIGVVATVLGASLVAAQDAPPINVQFTFSDPMVIGLYPNAAELANAEATLSSHLAVLFENSVTYWPAKSAAIPVFPLLRLQLQRDGSRWFVLVDLLPVAGQPPIYSEQVEVYAAGELSALGGFPPRQRLPERLERKLTEFYSTAASRDALRAKLGESAPLGAAAHVTSTPTRCMAILPLKWDRYCSLATSVFALEYGQPDGSRVIVIGQGLGEPAQFTPDTPRFTGVMVQPKRWMSGGNDEDVGGHLADFSKLTPRLFRLRQLTTDVSACIDVAGSPPSVAR